MAHKFFLGCCVGLCRDFSERGCVAILHLSKDHTMIVLEQVSRSKERDSIS